MPWAPKSICAAPFCQKIAESKPGARYCRVHLLAMHREINALRLLGDLESTWKWRKFSRWFLAQEQNRWCLDCRAVGKQTRSQQTAHIVAHRGNWDLCFDRNNVVPLCRNCHSRRTAKEDGGFGNKSRPKEIEGDDPPTYI